MRAQTFSNVLGVGIRLSRKLAAHPDGRRLGFGRRGGVEGLELSDRRAPRVSAREVALREHPGVDRDGSSEPE